jgi:hypothetical protein
MGGFFWLSPSTYPTLVSNDWRNRVTSTLNVSSASIDMRCPTSGRTTSWDEAIRLESWRAIALGARRMPHSRLSLINRADSLQLRVDVGLRDFALLCVLEWR